MPAGRPAVISETMNMVEYLVDRHLESRGDNVAVYSAERNLTYRDLFTLVSRYAGALASIGITPGDRIVLRAPLSIETLAVFLGAIRIGSCPIPTSILLTENDFSKVLDHSCPRLVIIQDRLIGSVRKLAERFDTVVIGEGEQGFRGLENLVEAATPLPNSVQMSSEDVAYMLYTSGSTGVPKGVMRPHRALLGSAHPNAGSLMGLSEGDVCYQPHQDLSFSYPLGHGVLFPLYCGASAVIEPARPHGRLNPETVYGAIERFKVTVFSAVTGVYRLLSTMADAPQRFSCGQVRLWTCAGEPLPPQLLETWQKQFGQPIYETMGQSEVPSFVGNIPSVPIRPGSLGKPFPSVPVSVVDDNYQECPVRVPGHLVINADYPGLCSGYYRIPEQWRAVCHDGWYFTRDLAYRDADGYLWYVGRSDDIINIKGYSVSPAEVEEALNGAPAVQQSGVLGGRDSEGETVICAFIELKSGVEANLQTEKAIRQRLSSRLTRFKQPEIYRFVEELPKTDSGKLKRRALKGMMSENQNRRS